ncbi:MAG: sigma-70 family RNA polymerase sigma factor [Nitrospira sp. NTP1]|nr:sigma-70 family RNA polymerase sigma factor [Nitrospira sp. NTP1]
MAGSSGNTTGIHVGSNTARPVGIGPRARAGSAAVSRPPLGVRRHSERPRAGDHHRRQQHRDTMTLDDPERPLDQADQGPSIERVVWSKQQVARLTRAIEELPPKCRQVFLLIKFHHLTHAEVATKLGIAQSTVVKHMIKAVDFCRSRLDEP